MRIVPYVIGSFLLSSAALHAQGTRAHLAGELPALLDFRAAPSALMPTVPEASGAHHKFLAVGDYDADGDPDVAMAIAAGTYGSRVNKLYRNDAGVLVEISGSLPEFTSPDVSRVAAFRDFDGDGWLDLLLVNDSFEFLDSNRLFVNRHPGGVFSHFEEEGGPRGLGRDWACGAVAADFDDDGDVDVQTANYGSQGQDGLYLNDGNGYFSDAVATNMPPETDFSVDAATGDVNGDGKLDILVCNEGAPSYVYYNDLNGAGEQGVGDYRYGSGGFGGVVDLGGSPVHAAIVPADFDGDGRLDLYRANAHGTRDVLSWNKGNDPEGKALFEELPVPSFPGSVASSKATVADLDGDGRPDVVLMTGDRPVLLRNVTVREPAFVDWTSAAAFPSGTALSGMSAAVLDHDGDGDRDVLIGAYEGDHLFERVQGRHVREAELSGRRLPTFFDGRPVAVLGRVAPGGSDLYRAGSLAASGHLSVVLRGENDLVLEILRDGEVVAVSDRGAAGVEEALQVELSAGSWSVRVSATGDLLSTREYLLEVLGRRDGPDNDDCAGALEIFDGLTPFNNIGASTDGPAHAACDEFGSDQIPADVWYDYVATCDGVLTVSTCGMADYDTKLAVYSGTDCPVGDGELLGCNEDTAGCDGYTSVVMVPASVGETFKIRVGGWLGAQGTGILSVSCQP